MNTEAFETRTVRMGQIDVPVIDVHGEVRVLLKPVVEDLGLNWTSAFYQVKTHFTYEKYKTDRWKNPHPMITLGMREFLRWALQQNHVPECGRAAYGELVGGVLGLIEEYGRTIASRPGP